MTHRIVLLGAGYAGFSAATRLTRQLNPETAEVTVVNPTPRFVERPRLHQVATGQRLHAMSLQDYLGDGAAKLLLGKATAIDLGRREVRVEAQEGPQVLAYDTLVYALGSTVDERAVPGVAEHAFRLTGPESAARLHARVSDLAPGSAVVVCGGGLTGIEVATELAENFPALRVRLVARGEPGSWLAPRGRAHLRRAFARLGVEVRAGADVREVRHGSLALAGGETMPFDLCVWAGGFRVPELAREAGLAVNGHGRVLVDETLRSLSHPEVYAIGDAAAASGPWGEQMAYGCRTGGFMGPYVADAIAARLAGATPNPFRFRYLHECVSLGRGDALVQFMHADERPSRHVLTGRAAIWYKEVVLSSVRWLFRFPGPYRLRPRQA
jgi:NADH dehydrogenase